MVFPQLNCFDEDPKM
uniref:Uncharacterized protein n=1 Tax=Rhizophora mucronata TaxID=61149 RepID=A0A2P2JGU0_RHIMU